MKAMGQIPHEVAEIDPPLSSKEKCGLPPIKGELNFPQFHGERAAMDGRDGRLVSLALQGFTALFCLKVFR
jgi:hypothetical protein